MAYKKKKYPYEGWKKATSARDGRAWKVNERSVSGISVYDVVSPENRTYWVTAVGSRARAELARDRLNKILRG